MHGNGRSLAPDGAVVTDLSAVRAGAAMLLGQALRKRFPDAELGGAELTHDGFHYDVHLPRPLEEHELAKLLKDMRRLLAGNAFGTVAAAGAQDIEGLFAGERFLLESARERVAQAPGGTIAVYRAGDHADLVPGTDQVAAPRGDAIALLGVSGAYWRGSSENPQLSRIAGAAFTAEADLAEWLKFLDRARQHDHRRLGRELELFTISDAIGYGLPLWLPKGAVIRQELEQFIIEEERRRGYQHVVTPQLAKKSIYERSGHWAHYHEDMFPVMKIGGEELVLRPMNCPHHIVVFDSLPHSYRELPLRLAELGTMYRSERSGVVGGLSRVRTMTLNDAHIFCTLDQIQIEFTRVLELIEHAYAVLGIRNHWYRLSMRDKEHASHKYVQDDEMWERAQKIMRAVLDGLDLPYVDGVGEAAFYGPKLDIQLPDLMGRDETISTIQVDFYLPQRFDISYIGDDGARHRPVIIHRAVLSTMERMVAHLIEHYGGAFPVWLSPVQALVIPVTDAQNEMAYQVAAQLHEAGIRVEVAPGGKTLGARIRRGREQKIPYMLIVGQREADTGAVTVRRRDDETVTFGSPGEFITLLRERIRARSLSL